MNNAISKCLMGVYIEREQMKTILSPGEFAKYLVLFNRYVDSVLKEEQSNLSKPVTALV